MPTGSNRLTNQLSAGVILTKSQVQNQNEGFLTFNYSIVLVIAPCDIEFVPTPSIIINGLFGCLFVRAQSTMIVYHNMQYEIYLTNQTQQSGLKPLSAFLHKL